MKTKITQNIKAIILGLVITLGMGYAAAQTFSGPTCSPTDAVGCNTPAPVNVGTSLQSKLGPLATLGLGVVGDFSFIPTGLTPPTAGQVLMADSTSAATLSAGKVKWGTVSGAEGSGSCQWYQSPTVNISASTAVSNGATGICRGNNNGVIKYSTLAGVPSGTNTDIYCGIVQGPAPMEYYGCSSSGSGSTPAGLIVGGFSGSNEGNGSSWGVAFPSGTCPAAYQSVYTGDTAQGNGQTHICLTK